MRNIICLGHIPVVFDNKDSEVFPDEVYTTVFLSYPAAAFRLYTRAPVWDNFFIEKNMVQILYEKMDNIVTIDVPGIAPSELIATAEGGTLVRKEGTNQWIARPTGERDSSGMKEYFIITIFSDENGKKEEIGSQTYVVKTAYVIDCYDRRTHSIRRGELIKSDYVLLKADGVKTMCFHLIVKTRSANNHNLIVETRETQCGFRFSRKGKRLLHSMTGDKKVSLSFYNIRHESDEKKPLSSIELTLSFR